MSDEVRFERIIDAPADAVFEAFTSQGGQEAFYGHDDPSWIVESSCDLRVGGVWTVTFGPAPDRLTRHRHRFEAIDRPRRLVLTTTELRTDRTSFDFTTEYTFEEHDGRTLMAMIQTDLPTALRDEHAGGVSNSFDRLAIVLRDRTAADRRPPGP